MKVKNINATRVSSCTCGSWLEHWKRHSDQPLSIFCAVLDCIQKPEAGAHVQKDGPDDDGWYIVPLCNAHNGQYGTSSYITDAVTLVSANVGRTCGSGKSKVAGGTCNATSEIEANHVVKGKIS
jgi:hypothetical protein